MNLADFDLWARSELEAVETALERLTAIIGVIFILPVKGALNLASDIRHLFDE